MMVLALGTGGLVNIRASRRRFSSLIPIMTSSSKAPPLATFETDRSRGRTCAEKGRDALLARGYLGTEMRDSRVRKLNRSTALNGTVAIRIKTNGTELERAAFRVPDRGSVNPTPLGGRGVG